MSLNEIGNFLTNFRNEIGESLRTMASKLDISATYLSAIENNKRNIPADFLDKFMEVYNVDEDAKKKLEKANINFKVKTGAQDKVFGSISSKQIVDELKKLGFDINKTQIKLDTPLSSLGTHIVHVELHKKVIADIKVKLEK